MRIWTGTARTWRPTPVEWVAVALTALAVLAVIAYFTTSAADAWAPNIATEAFSIAVTIAVVERIVTRQARERLRPRTERVIYWVGLNLRLFTSAVVTDYAGTHLHSFKPIPRDLIEMFEFWLEEQKNEDAASIVEVPGARYPMLIACGIEFYDDVKRHVDPNREILEPALIRAVDDLSWHVGQAMQSHDFSKAHWIQDRPAYDRSARSHIVRGGLQFAEAFRDPGDAGWLEILDLTADSAESHRDAVLVRARLIAPDLG
jgi:hypothetical protein